MYLGIDLGTSGLKVLLIDDEQSVIASASESLTVSRPHLGWSEQNPQDWISACKTAISNLKQNFPSELLAVQGIGLSGQMHGATLLDKAEKPLRPCMLWNDVRSAQEASSFDKNPEFRKISGNIVFPGFTAPKVEWVRKHEPMTFENTAKVLLPKDYIRLWLTGEFVTDLSDASGTGWLDCADRSWSPVLLKESKLQIDKMPRVMEGTEVSGLIKPKIANELGIRKNAIVVGGAGDNAATAMGLGIIKEGNAFLSLGTSGVLFAANNAFRPKPESAVHTFCHAIPNTWHQMGVILSATDSLNWYANLVGKKAGDLTSEVQVDEPSTTMFLPYLSGERTPHNDADIGGAFVGLRHAKTTEQSNSQMVQAVLEGVAFAFRDNLTALNSTGTYPTRLLAVGGGAKSNTWLQILANVLKLPIDRSNEAEVGAAFGAARLGFIGAEGLNPEEICIQPLVQTTFEAVSELSQAYDRSYTIYSKLYPAIKAAQA